ncbi:hypothetical protein VNO77_44257 [Canavalia gladiata]|uniref:Uncharacterized protein n=1 Tax=Canavalia gladiata TaxID=3824 RepID=A0AAN9JWD5_CANGL
MVWHGILSDATRSSSGGPAWSIPISAKTFSLVRTASPTKLTGLWAPPSATSLASFRRVCIGRTTPSHKFPPNELRHPALSFLRGSPSLETPLFWGTISLRTVTELEANRSIPSPQRRDETPRRLELPWRVPPHELASIHEHRVATGRVEFSRIIGKRKGTRRRGRMGRIVLPECTYSDCCRKGPLCLQPRRLAMLWSQRRGVGRTRAAGDSGTLVVDHCTAGILRLNTSFPWLSRSSPPVESVASSRNGASNTVAGELDKSSIAVSTGGLRVSFPFSRAAPISKSISLVLSLAL